MSSSKRVVLYLRLSKEDIGLSTQESISKSIKNQKLMLEEEVKKHPSWQIIATFCDEDFSGAGSFRPGFAKMIKMCEKKEVDIVLCKSQSRFSRDMEVIEKYLHNKFLEWQVRFISLVDNVDTLNKSNKKARQINALINEWFLEDLSENIKATLHAKWLNGECTSPFVQYGFIKDPKNKNHIILDPIPTKVKKLIAELYLQGYGQEKIANILEEKNIPSPYEYKMLMGSNLKIPQLKNQDDSIKKTGTYIIKFFLSNDYKQVIKNYKSIITIKNDENKSDKLSIKIHLKSENILLYYTTKNIDSNIWNKIEKNDKIPIDATNFLVHIPSLDRLDYIWFELEIKILENKSQQAYKIYTKPLSGNLTLDYSIRKKFKWSGRMINKILRDPINNGDLIQGKTRRISYKNHKSIINDKEQCIVIKNALEKTFDDNLWNSIQDKLNKSSKSGTNGLKHIFSGKIYCEECGSIMCKNSSQNKNGDKIYYLLCQDKKNKWQNCTNNKSIKFNEVYKYVLKSFNDLLKKYYDKKILKDLYIKMIEKNQYQEELKNLKAEKEEVKNLINKKEFVFKNLYMDKISGIIDESEFLVLKDKIKEEKDKLIKRSRSIKEEINNIKNNQSKLKKCDEIIEAYQQVDRLSQSLIDEFIDKIEIKSISNNDRINIHWNLTI